MFQGSETNLEWQVIHSLCVGIQGALSFFFVAFLNVRPLEIDWNMDEFPKKTMN